MNQVRNPVAAAMSACSFVKTALKRKDPLQDEEALATTREDVYIIDNALKFVNDLLRNMLDMHRAANKQLKVTLSPTDILHDVLEPVQAMLIQRGGKVDVHISCDDGIFALADRLRLKQVMLNLGRNSGASFWSELCLCCSSLLLVCTDRCSFWYLPCINSQICRRGLYSLVRNNLRR